MNVSSEPLATSAYRVVLVDSRDERRQRMRHSVDGGDATAVIVGEADGEVAALEMVDEQRADAVVLDVQMPVSVGLATIASLRERHPHLGIVVCSFDLDRTTVERVLAAGADSCLAKPLRREDVHAALRALPHQDRRGESGPDAALATPCAAPAAS